MIVTRSIRNRLALSATCLVLAVVAVIAGAAYVEARRSAISSATQRLRDVSRQLTDLLVVSARQMHDQSATLARIPALGAYVANRSAPATADAIATLGRVVSTGNGFIVVELWDAHGNRLLTTADSIEAVPAKDATDAIALARPPDSAAIGFMSRGRGRLWYTVIARVMSPAGDTGYVVQRRVFGAAAQQVSQLRDLVGSEAAIIVGNTRGDLWTDFADSTATPPIDARGPKRDAEYERPPGNLVLSSVSPIAGSPWAIAVEFPRRTVLAPVNATMRRLGVFAILLLLVAAAGAWAVSGTLTRPIAELVSAANAITAGSAGAHIKTDRDDEFGALARAFNDMSSRVTESRQALERKFDELADAESRYRLLFQDSPQPMFVYDVETHAFLAVNGACVQTYGYTPEEFAAMSILDIRPPEDVPQLLEDFSKLSYDGVAESPVRRHRTCDGRLIEVEARARSLTFRGRHARIVVVNDLTNRRRAEDSLRAAQQRLERVMNSSGAVLYELRLDAAGTVLEWISDNVVAMFGHDMTDVASPTWWIDNIHPADRPKLANRPNVDAYKDGAIEYRLRHRDGRYRLVRDDQRLISDGPRRPRKVIGALMDLTEQRHLETQFRQAQKMEAIGRLAGGVAHDFNNLLTVIIAECQYLLSDPNLSVLVRTDSVDQIGKAADRAALLTRQLLTFSRQQLVEPNTLDVNAIVSDIDKMLRRLIGEDVDLRVSLSSEPAVTVADRGQLEQVIVNLAVNARDAMPVGGSLTIETGRTRLDQSYADAHPDVTAGEYVLIAVSDTGIGMDEEVKSHIFEPFFTTKDDGKGTGLGLATCYAIARQFGGHIAAYSELGFGTTMKVYLPSTRTPVTSGSHEAAEPAGGTETILLVEDDEQVRRLTARMLKARGYTVLQAGDAPEALEVLGQHPAKIDLLLTDVVLPGTGGRPLADRVLTLRPGISVLFASGYSDDVILQHRLTAHGVVLLHKPFTADALGRKVREALARPGKL